MPAGLVTDADGDTLVYPVDKGSGATTSLVDADGVVAVDPDTEYLGEDDEVEVQLFSPDVRPPTLLAVGEPDPALSRLLDDLRSPRFLPVGSREGLRRLRGGVPDIAVVAGPTDREVDSVDLGGWTREWGLVVPPGSPDGIEGLGDLVDRDLAFVNRGTDSGLRSSLDAAIDDLAADRGASRSALTDAIRGYGIGTKGFESPARAVARGDADAGLGLRATAESLGLDFVTLGTESVRVRANPDRVGKPGVEELAAGVEAIDRIVDGLAGYGSD
jgi:molybdate-binding protein